MLRMYNLPGPFWSQNCRVSIMCVVKYSLAESLRNISDDDMIALDEGPAGITGKW